MSTKMKGCKSTKGGKAGPTTPGPWHVGASNVCAMDGMRIHRFPISGGGRAIASVWNGTVGKEWLTSGTGEANARLIASAPDLLAALEAIAKFPALHNMTGGGDRSHQAMVNMARAAIAKAST